PTAARCPLVFSPVVGSRLRRLDVVVGQIGSYPRFGKAAEILRYRDDIGGAFVGMFGEVADRIDNDEFDFIIENGFQEMLLPSGIIEVNPFVDSKSQILRNLRGSASGQHLSSARL